MLINSKFFAKLVAQKEMWLVPLSVSHMESWVGQILQTFSLVICETVVRVYTCFQCKTVYVIFVSYNVNRVNICIDLKLNNAVGLLELWTQKHQHHIQIYTKYDEHYMSLIY